ncbi:MAG: hypothetical protein ABL997_13775 [Planctomycetota bacterium]
MGEQHLCIDEAPLLRKLLLQVSGDLHCRESVFENTFPDCQPQTIAPFDLILGELEPPRTGVGNSSLPKVAARDGHSDSPRTA